MVGLIDDISHITRSTFRQDGDAILLLGDTRAELGGSEYLATIHDTVAGQPPVCDLVREKAVIDALLETIRAGVVSSAHDCSDGGLAVALAECCIADVESQIGADIDLSAAAAVPARAVLFGESQARVIVSSLDPQRVIEIATSNGVPCARIGTVRKQSAALSITLRGRTFSSPLVRLHRAYHETIPKIMSRTPEHATFDELAPVAAH
jgi:phosphoribosylformylglycinamidine synthase